MPDGYYSRDKPNPNLKAFVEDHIKENPYDPIADDYLSAPLLRSSKVKRSTKIFNMHTYWSKKPHDSVESFVKNYTQDGDLVLDPFCGSGGTVLVSVLSGRNAIGIDLSPSAIFVSSALCALPSLVEFQSTFDSIMRTLRAEYGWLYEYPYRRQMFPIHFGISSMQFQCLKCLQVSSLSRCPADSDDKARCPHCGEPIKTNQEKFGYKLDEWHLFVKQGNHIIVPSEDQDLDYENSIQKRINLELLKHVPPDHDFPSSGRTQVLAVRGIKNLTNLYTQRNLLALCVYRDFCQKIDDEKLKNALLFVLTACCLKTSRMMGLNQDGIGRIQKNGLIAQLIVKDVNVFDFLEIAQRGIISGYNEILDSAVTDTFSCLFSTQSATELSEIPSQSVDYIFTDPPYGSRVQFWESNQVWEAWLGFDTNWANQEIIVNRTRGLDETHWNNLFRQSMIECFRVLKPGRWITLTYNDRETWPILQNVMHEIGFIPDGSESPVTMETTAKSEKQLKKEDNTLRDLVISFRKPRPNEVSEQMYLTGNEDLKTFTEKVLSIITNFLSLNPGSSKNHIQDEIISRMVRKGELEHHRLDEMLDLVAEEIKDPIKRDLFQNEPPNLFGTHEISRWYLKESQIDIVDTAESAKEDSAAESVSEFIRKCLAKYPEKEGVHYSDIFEHFIYVVRDKPRRPLAEWLLDYFYKTDEGTYRLPISEEEKRLKSESRSKGTNRRIKRYIAFFEQGITIPEKERPNDATLAEWIRHCKRSGLYEQGKLLYERGGLNLDNLSEEVMVNVEEDYQTCIRMLNRTVGLKKGKV